MEKKETFNCVGLMSGTSCDGLDIAFCRFVLQKGQPVQYQILSAEMVEYSPALVTKLKSAENFPAFDFVVLDRDYGTYLGTEVRKFLSCHPACGDAVDFVASHGHTIFHQPDKHLTVQIGNPNSLAVAAGLPVVADFRSLNVALGGEGAPLVPIGDKLLFAEYDFCLNLGGIANISFDSGKENTRIAFDICPMNMVLNHFALLKGKEFDEDGKLARAGKVLPSLIPQLEKLDYFSRKYPKSLGKEWVYGHFIPVLTESKANAEDLLATATEFACRKIAATVVEYAAPGKRRMLVTGGGAFNGLVIERLRELLRGKCEVVVPDGLIVKYKEALIFAFLGVLRWTGQVNCLRSVTGAERDCVGGVIVHG